MAFFGLKTYFKNFFLGYFCPPIKVMSKNWVKIKEEYTKECQLWCYADCFLCLHLKVWILLWRGAAIPPSPEGCTPISNTSIYRPWVYFFVNFGSVVQQLQTDIYTHFLTMIYAVLYAFMSQVDMGHFRAYLGYSYSRVLARQSRAWGEEALMLPEAGMKMSTLWWQVF